MAAIPARKHGLTQTETDLIQRCQEGDRAAFELLVRKFERKVFGLIYQIVRSPHDVEDISQEVFIKLYFSLSQFRLKDSFDAWLYRIVVNQCYDHLRKRKRNPQIREADLSEEEALVLERLGSLTQPKQTDIARRLETRQVAENLLRALPPRDRSLLILREIEELSIEELMQVFKTSRSAIKLRLFRARKYLKSVYEKSKRRQRK